MTSTPAFADANRSSPIPSADPHEIIETHMRSYRSADGTHWGIAVNLPGSSNAMVIFRHPDGESSRQDRYNWFISKGPEARSVTSRLSKERVLEGLTDDDLARLFRRSMSVSRPDPLVPVGLDGG
jgi:hypothetical protein